MPIRIRRTFYYALLQPHSGHKQSLCGECVCTSTSTFPVFCRTKDDFVKRVLHVLVSGTVVIVSGFWLLHKTMNGLCLEKLGWCILLKRFTSTTISSLSISKVSCFILVQQLLLLLPLLLLFLTSSASGCFSLLSSFHVSGLIHG